ncbi:serine protease, partial [Ideonella sp. 4Y11]
AAAAAAAPVEGPTAAAPAAAALPPPAAAAPGPALSPEALFARASASVVRINAQSGQGGVSGSGVVLGPGTVVTNCHVARGGARLRVLQGAQGFDASVELADETHDLCRLSVPGLDAPAAPIGRVASLRVGQKVYAIGSPRGLDLTLSDGLVSSLRETPEGTLIQTSAPISPGSSGGGLFTEDGLLVGIVTFQVRDGQNLNFAVPVDWVLRMSPTDRSRGSALPPMRSAGPSTESQPPRTAGTDSPLVGRWECFGPLTGRGITLVFGADGRLGGQMEGRAINGRYQLRDSQLLLADGSGTERYAVESLGATRLVLNAGQGRRLACSR